jgi:hypothetical protein
MASHTWYDLNPAISKLQTDHFTLMQMIFDFIFLGAMHWHWAPLLMLH